MIPYPNKIISIGSKDADSVRLIKSRLNSAIGCNLDINNSTFGATTKDCVIEFQGRNQLLRDGKVGELTWERLFTVSVLVLPSSPILRVRAVQIADTQLYVRELTGHNDGKEVEAYLKSVSLRRGFPYCQALVFWCFDRGAKELGRDNPVPRTGGVLECLRLAKKSPNAEVFAPNEKEVQEGDQFIMDFGGGKGHTGFVNEPRGSRFFSAEGNTSADPSYKGEDREGNGNFERNRRISACKAFIRWS